MRNFVVLCLVLFIASCKTKTISKLKNGIYKAELLINDSETLPFLFEVTSETNLKVFNADEIIEVDEIEYMNDSVYIKMPVFEGFLVAKIENNKLNGSFVKANLNRVVPFIAAQNENRFDIGDNVLVNITGSWETVFSPDSEEDRYIAKGVFNQNGHKLIGTFQTTTGDYRYLEGIVNGNEIKLSTFDGAHAFLFTATITDSIMKGVFYSGDHWKEPFFAKRNDNYELPSVNELTFLNEGYDKISFSFPDTQGRLVSLDDDRFNNKVVLVQIMGTWCPNCLDESKYYADYYKANKDKGLEIVALAFEYVKIEKNAFNNIKRLTNRIGIEYPILLAQTGTTSKTKAQEKLPMLNHVLSYPTTIFIDKHGVVRKIHTGFNGPATGEKFIAFKAEFENFVDSLLNE
ncbi:MAG: TlpA family protein disulfide reductase [Bacteroidetes bacterium]|nr:TlpA family protein disulfide reductase [Bacteroidota bacterium]